MTVSQLSLKVERVRSGSWLWRKLSYFFRENNLRLGAWNVLGGYNFHHPKGHGWLANEVLDWIFHSISSGFFSLFPVLMASSFAFALMLDRETGNMFYQNWLENGSKGGEAAGSKPSRCWNCYESVIFGSFPEEQTYFLRWKGRSGRNVVKIFPEWSNLKFEQVGLGDW